MSIEFTQKEKAWISEMKDFSQKQILDEIEEIMKEAHIRELQIMTLKLFFLINEKNERIKLLEDGLEEARQLLRKE